MAYNRNKLLAKAQKLLQKGKIDEAILAYQEVVESDPSDIRTLLKIGDLQAKLGNVEMATDTYRKVGEHYAKDGFFLKAVAVFKQILKLDPGLILVYTRLAELYQHLGLNSEAMKQYQVVVRHYEMQGLKKESLDILQKMAELEPDNSASKLKLAELYAKEGHTQEATNQFKIIAKNLKEKKNTQDLARTYEKMETLGLADNEGLLELVGTYLEIGEPKRALVKLQKLFQQDPKNPKVLELLAQSFCDLSQPEKAKSVYSELIHILKQTDQAGECEKFEAKIKALATLSPSPSENERAKNAPQEVFSSKISVPEESLSPMEPASLEEDDHRPVPKLLEEAEIFLQYGLIDKACDTLEKAFLLSPANEKVRIQMMETLERKGDVDRIRKVLEKGMAIALSQQLKETVAILQSEIQSRANPVPSSGEIPSESGMSDLEPEFEIVDDASPSLPEENEFERPLESSPEASVELSIFSPLEGSSSKNEPVLEEEPSFEISFDDVSLSESDLQELGKDQNEPPKLAESGEPSFSLEDSSSFEKEEKELVSEEEFEPKVDFQEKTANVSLSEETQILLSTPDEPLQPFSESREEPAEAIVLDSPSTSSESEEIIELGSEETVFTPEDSSEEIHFTLAEPEKVQETISKKPISFSEEVDSPPPAPPLPSIERLEEKKTSSSAKDSSPKILEEEKERDKGGAFFDLSSELQEEIEELEVELSRAKDKKDEDYLSPEEVISEFKKGVARIVSKDDFQTHYNLGIAYKEMGLLDEAIHEFEISMGDPHRLLDGTSMIGLCLMGKRDYLGAINLYRKILAQTPPQAPEILGLSYELAEAFIGHGNLHEAYKLFSKVCDIDPSFRDVRRRAKELELDLGMKNSSLEEAEKLDQDKRSVVKIAKKNKISYI